MLFFSIKKEKLSERESVPPVLNVAESSHYIHTVRY